MVCSIADEVLSLTAVNALLYDIIPTKNIGIIQIKKPVINLVFMLENIPTFLASEK
jgi:hypothetical protein